MSKLWSSFSKMICINIFLRQSICPEPDPTDYMQQTTNAAPQKLMKTPRFKLQIDLASEPVLRIMYRFTPPKMLK